MSTRKTTISSYFVAPRQSSGEQIVRQEDDTHLSNSMPQRIEENENSDQSDVNEESEDVETQSGKRKGPPTFGGTAILKKKSTRVGSIVLTSIEETHVPDMSVRSRERESKTLVASNRVEKTGGQSKMEIQLRISDKKNMGLLVTKQVDGLIRLWCRVCLKVVNPNKSNCQSHMDSALHKRNIEKDGQNVAEEIVLSPSLKKWRLGNPDNEGRTLTENTDFFRMETVLMLMLSGVEISKVRDEWKYRMYPSPFHGFTPFKLRLGG